MRTPSLILALCLMFPSGGVSAHSVQSADIAVGHIWAYPAQGKAEQGAFDMSGKPQGYTVDVFGPVLNGGAAEDAITGVTTPVSPKAGIVRWIRGQQMTQDFPVPLLSDQPVAFGPQTFFIRLYGVNSAAKPGDRFPVTFHFRNAPEATIDVMVQAR